MSYFKPRNLLLVLALILAVVLLMVIFQQRRPEAPPLPVSKVLPKGVDIALQDIDYTHVEGGLARWRMVAKEVTRQSDSGVLSIRSPQLSFFDKQGLEVSSLQAQSGTVTEDYQKVTLLNDVVLKNSAGYTIYTQALDYDHEQQLARSESHVRIESKGMRFEGEGMNFYVAQKKVLLLAKVKGHIQP